MNQEDSEENRKPVEIKYTKDDRLNIFYDKEEMEDYFPNLTSEISQRKKSVRISAVEEEIEREKKVDFKFKYEEDISNPGIIDFLRRCSNIREANEILEYMYKRKEVSKELHGYLKELISQEERFKELVEKCGGPKKKGYYINKFYDKNEDLNLD